MKPSKKEVLESFLAHFENELHALIQSAKAAHLAATHEESRAEDRHDTFAIEASYLAAGQAARVADLQESVKEIRGLLESQKNSPTPIPGTLITLELDGKKSYSLIAKFGGGAQVKVNGMTVSIVTPSSPLGDHLTGLNAGDGFTIDSKFGSRDYTLIAVE